MLGFAITNNLVLITVLTVTIAGNQFEMESFLSKFSNFTSEISFCAIHILLPPKGFLSTYSTAWISLAPLKSCSF
jgi:hypothetical protein